jgi:hypothetical protein
MDDIVEALREKFPKESMEKIQKNADRIYAQNLSMKKAEEEMKSSEVSFSKIGDKEFFEMFHGMNMITGSGKGYVSAFEFLAASLTSSTGAYLKRILETCVIVNEKPKLLLMTGKTRTGKGEGRALDPLLADLMPKLTEEELFQLASSSIPEDKAGYEARMLYQGNWKYVNFSMVRRIAMMVIENRIREFATESPVIGQIYAKYPAGIVAHEFNLENCGKRQFTLDAKLKSQSEVSKAKVFWKTQDWKGLFEQCL